MELLDRQFSRPSMQAANFPPLCLASKVEFDSSISVEPKAHKSLPRFQW
jgi:hypothetical protein